MLELRDVSKSYREGERVRAVLIDVDHRFESGELVVIMGRSGSGKSTLLNIVAGIDLPDSGEVRLDNVNLAALSERDRTLARRAKMGFVFQFFNLIPTLTVEENLLLPLELNGVARSRALARIERMLGEVGLEQRRESFPDSLSGGEQQRIAVARALVHEPRLVLADEPTGNLDRETGREVLTLLRSLVTGGGRLLIMATHSREAAGFGDRVLSIEDRTLLEISPRAEREGHHR